MHTLPDVPVAEMAARDPSVLYLDIASAVERLLLLRSRFEPQKLPPMLTECPRLLYCDDLEERIETATGAIIALFPKETMADAILALTEVSFRLLKR